MVAPDLKMIRKVAIHRILSDADSFLANLIHDSDRASIAGSGGLWGSRAVLETNGSFSVIGRRNQ
jgi:hypothetical protein